MTSEFRGVVFVGIVAVCMKLRFVTNAFFKCMIVMDFFKPILNPGFVNNQDHSLAHVILST